MKDDSFLEWQGWVREETPALVGVLTRRKDFEILKREHWYRIPVKNCAQGVKEDKVYRLLSDKGFWGGEMGGQLLR